MWPFKREKASKHNQPGLPCPYCKSSNTKLVSSSQVTGESAYIKTWRGESYITCGCSECGREFYIEATIQNIEKIIPSDQSIIEDEDELMAAEEEIKRQADEENDRRFKGNN